MSIKSKLGKAAAGTVIAGVITVSGMSLANAADITTTTDSGTITTTTIDPTSGTTTGTIDGTSTTGGSAAPTPGDGTTGTITDPISTTGDPTTPVAGSPAPTPVPAPTPEAPGKSGSHRASTPQQALDNNQSHKQKADKMADTDDQQQTEDSGSEG